MTDQPQDDPRVRPVQPPQDAVPPRDARQSADETIILSAVPPQAAPPAPQQQGPQAPPPGYGYPQPQPQPQPQPPTYGYPQHNAYAAPQLPTQPGFPAAGTGFPPQQPPFQPAPAGLGGSGEPDWSAMAEQHEARAKRSRRLRLAAIVVAACVLGTATGLLAVRGLHHEAKPQASGSPSASSGSSGSPSASASRTPNSPTVPGEPTVLADRSGSGNLAIGPNASVGPVSNGYVLRLRADGNSYAQSSEPLVDVSKGFAVSAWVFNQSKGGTRTAFSQGDGISFSFDIGCGVSGTSPYWFFTVQTGGSGADSTTIQVRSKSVPTLNQWTLITASYDVKAHTIALYLNGEPAGTAKVSKIWSGPGPFQIGRNRHHGMWDEFWNGVIGHVQVWNSPLTAADAAKLKAGSGKLTAEPVHSWLVG